MATPFHFSNALPGIGQPIDSLNKCTHTHTHKNRAFRTGFPSSFFADSINGNVSDLLARQKCAFDLRNARMSLQNVGSVRTRATRGESINVRTSTHGEKETPRLFAYVRRAFDTTLSWAQTVKTSPSPDR